MDQTLSSLSIDYRPAFWFEMQGILWLVQKGKEIEVPILFPLIHNAKDRSRGYEFCVFYLCIITSILADSFLQVTYIQMTLSDKIATSPSTV